eukprot:3773656-Rhodomonas_salina.1
MPTAVPNATRAIAQCSAAPLLKRRDFRPPRRAASRRIHDLSTAQRVKGYPISVPGIVCVGGYPSSVLDSA